MMQARQFAVLLGCAWASLLHSAADAQTITDVQAPSGVQGGDEFTAHWVYDDGAGGTSGRFHVNLMSCEEGVCDNGGCGDSDVELCPDVGCSDSAGDAEVMLPTATEAGTYLIKVILDGNSQVYSCGPTFEVGDGSGNFPTASEEGVTDATMVADTPGGPLAPGDLFTATWTYDNGAGGTEGRFDIDLYYCGEDGASCENGHCGDLAYELCPAAGCPDSAGDYNVQVPNEATPGLYTLAVRRTGKAAWDCSGQFQVCYLADGSCSDVATPEPVAPGEEPEGATIKVYNPMVLVADDAFTATWIYQDGAGGSEGRFDIDLYACDADCFADEGNCGVFAHPLCEKADGCHDTAGDYNVVMPWDVVTGDYKLVVGLHGTALSSCSPAFEILGVDENGVIVLPNGTASTTGETTVVDVPTSTTYQVADDYSAYLQYKHPSCPDPDQKELCDPTIIFDIRYAATTERIYYEHADKSRGGCATLSQLYATRVEKTGLPKGPLYPIDADGNVMRDETAVITGKWLVESDIYVKDGITLLLYGTDIGGDCDELYIQSTDTKFFNLRGHGGNIDMRGTKVFGWDTDTNSYRTSYDTGRSYISCVSESMTDPAETCNGMGGEAKNEMGECRMDVVESELGYLGWFDSESYGVVWKVRGLCKDLSNLEIFDNMQVRGNIIKSDIHHMYYGHYTYGHQGGIWVDTDMHDNPQYGFDPHDDSDCLIIHGNTVWNNGNHGIIASKRCDHVTITDNTVYDGGVDAAGIFLHRSSDYAIVERNQVDRMQDAGLAIMESYFLDVSNNNFDDVKYGVRLSVGSGNNNIHDNVINKASEYGFFTYESTSDLPLVPGADGRPSENTFQDNSVTNTVTGFKFKEADTTWVLNNDFSGVDGELVFWLDNSGDMVVTGNTWDTEPVWTVKNGACFASGSQYEEADCSEDGEN